MIELDKISSAIEIELRDGMHFDAVGVDGVSVALDADAAHGGTGRGFRPLELMLVGLGSCTGMDVISILRKKRQSVAKYLVEVSATQADEHPHVFTRIAIRHVFQGENISDEAVRRAIELSESKYCPAFAMLSAVAPIHTEYEIHSPGS